MVFKHSAALGARLAPERRTHRCFGFRVTRELRTVLLTHTHDPVVPGTNLLTLAARAAPKQRGTVGKFAFGDRTIPKHEHARTLGSDVLVNSSGARAAVILPRWPHRVALRRSSS